MPVKMDVDEEADDGVSVAPNSELSALDRSWYLDEDAPLALPMRPFPNGYGTYHGTGSRSTSRAPSRAASRAARSPLPNFRGAPSPWQRPGGLAGIGEDGDGFPPSSAAAVLFASAGIADISDAAAASDSSPGVSLGDLGSGQLGELVVHKSGKVCLQIGGLMLEVQPGTVCSHHQEVVTMGMPEQEGGSVELHRLGPMHDRLVVTPNIDELLGLRR